jgi:hypothetical protein
LPGTGDGGSGASTSAIEAIPDRFLSEEQLAAARAVLERVVGLDATRLAFVSGSLAAGLGHAMSDVDLYVSAEPGVEVADHEYHEGRHVVQINPIRPDELTRLIAVTTEFTAGPADRWQVNLTDQQLTPAVRYAIGTVLIDRGSGLPPAPQAWQTMRQVLMVTRAITIATYAEDVLGALTVGDELTALQTTNIAVGLAVECLLAGVGDLYVGQKFNLRRLARSGAVREALPLLWESLRLPAAPLGLTGTRWLVEGRLRLVGRLVADVLLDGWDKPLDQLPAYTEPRTGGGPLRSPWVLPVRFADSWGMIGPDTGYRSKEGMVRLWRQLDGRPVDELHRDLAGDPAFAGTSRELLDTALARLIENKVAVPGGEDD